MKGEMLKELLTEKFPLCELKLTEFPSGAFMIDIHIQGEVYVIESVDGGKYGISKQRTATFGWEGVEHVIQNDDQLIVFLKNI